MCMAPGWSGLDAQYTIGNMIGGKTGELMKDSSASSTLSKYGSEKKPASTPQVQPPRTETRSALYR